MLRITCSESRSWVLRLRIGQVAATRREPNRLRLLVAQNARCRRRFWLELRYSCVVFQREILEPLLGEGVGVFGETAAAFGLFF